MSDYRLVIEFVDHLQNVTTSNYDSLTELRTRNITVTTAHTKSSKSSAAVAWYRFPPANVPLTLGSRSVRGLSYQLLAQSQSRLQMGAELMVSFSLNY
jgi:hypothetical protein